MLNSSPVGEGRLRIVEPLVGQVHHVVCVHVGYSLGNLRASHTTANPENLISNLLVNAIATLDIHELVPETISATDDFNFVNELSPCDWNGNSNVVHLSAEDLIAENVISPDSTVRVGFVLAICKGNINQISKHSMSTIVLLAWFIDVSSVSINSIVADHLLHQEERIVVLVVSAWGIKENSHIGVVHLIISNHQKRRCVDRFFLSTTLSNSILANSNKAIANLLD